MARAKHLGLMFAVLEPPPDMEEEFNEWYDTEHIPERKAISGFLTAQRFVAQEGSPKYLALYDLSEVDVLDSEAYRRIGPGHYSSWTRRVNRKARIFKRYVYQQTSPGDGLLSEKTNAVWAWMNDIPEAKRPQFDGWYKEKCLFHLKQLPEFIQARRFHCVEGEANDLALLEFRDPLFPTREKFKGIIFSDEAVRAREGSKEVMAKVYKKYNRA